MRTDHQLLEQLLELHEPWEIRAVRTDIHGRRCEVEVGLAAPRTWFGLVRKSSAPAVERGEWRHLNLAGFRYVVRVVAPASVSLERYEWTGEPEQPFTRAMSARLTRLLAEGVSLEGICRLFGVDPGEIWRLKRSLETRSVRISPLDAAGAAPDTGAGPAAGAAPGLPEADDPVWGRLAGGDISIDIGVLSLKLLLTRVRSQYEAMPDDESRRLKARELHRFFVKNLRMLGAELQQLRASALREEA